MDPMSMKCLVDKWGDLGLQPFDIHENNPIKWVDMCVVDTFCGGLTLPCDWIVVDSDIAFMKGTTAGNIVGREPGSE